MAEFEAEVKAQDIIKELKADRLFTDTNLKTILSAGADVLLDSVKSAYVAAGHNRRTGETYRHIVRPNTVKRDKQDVPYMVVTLRGKDARQQPYNIKGFVLNYGRKSRNLWKRRGGAIKADHYWNQAIKAARAASNEAMRKEAINILNR
ncbi:MAG: hypothetical protein U0N04_02000 [Oscillospiraceae bacterium]|jgi:hypothetical protein|nr:MAG TPA: hypothetical protein [Caudoviricetes sp.]